MATRIFPRGRKQGIDIYGNCNISAMDEYLANNFKSSGRVVDKESFKANISA